MKEWRTMKMNIIKYYISFLSKKYVLLSNIVQPVAVIAISFILGRAWDNIFENETRMVILVIAMVVSIASDVFLDFF